jgi:hypothetical protein
MIKFARECLKNISTWNLSWNNCHENKEYEIRYTYIFIVFIEKSATSKYKTGQVNKFLIHSHVHDAL